MWITGFPNTIYWRASLVAQIVNNLPSRLETWVWSLGRKIPWRRKWQPTPVLLPGKSHGWTSLVGYSPWGCKESDTTERLHFHFLDELHPTLPFTPQPVSYPIPDPRSPAISHPIPDPGSPANRSPNFSHTHQPSLHWNFALSSRIFSI